jgi:hypothetical protein
VTTDRLQSRLRAIAKAAPAFDAPKIKKRIDRKEPRTPAYRIGKVRFAGAEIAATILDVSASGAKAKLAGAHPLPPEVDLIIPQLGYRKRCAVRWQEGDMCGLEVTAAAFGFSR